MTTKEGCESRDKRCLLPVIQEDHVINLALPLWRWAADAAHFPCLSPLSTELNTEWWITQYLTGGYWSPMKGTPFSPLPPKPIKVIDPLEPSFYPCHWSLPSGSAQWHHSYHFKLTHTCTQRVKVKVSLSLCVEGEGGHREKGNWLEGKNKTGEDEKNQADCYRWRQRKKKTALGHGRVDIRV